MERKHDVKDLSYFFTALLVWAPLNCQTPEYCLCDFCLCWKLHNYVSSRKKYYHLTVNRYPPTFCNPKRFGAHRQKYWGNDYGILSLTWTEVILQNNIIVWTTGKDENTSLHNGSVPKVSDRTSKHRRTLHYQAVLWTHYNVEYF